MQWPDHSTAPVHWPSDETTEQRLQELYDVEELSMVQWRCLQNAVCELCVSIPTADWMNQHLALPRCINVVVSPSFLLVLVILGVTALYSLTRWSQLSRTDPPPPHTHTHTHTHCALTFEWIYLFRNGILCRTKLSQCNRFQYAKPSTRWKKLIIFSKDMASLSLPYHTMFIQLT